MGGVELVFAYGSNMDIDQLRGRCPDSRDNSARSWRRLRAGSCVSRDTATKGKAASAASFEFLEKLYGV